MKTAFSIAVLAFLLITPSPCFALWVIAPVSREGSKAMGMEVRSAPAGPNQVRVELEFKTEGRFAEFSPTGRSNYRSGVELRVDEEKNPVLTARLQEDRSKPVRIVVSFQADRAILEKIKLHVMVPESDGGTVYVLSVKDFVELKKDR